MQTKRDKKLYTVVIEIYRKMYAESTPVGDWDKMTESGETNEQDFFDNYVLSEERQIEIIDQIIKSHKWIRKYERPRIKNTVYLGKSPRFKPKK